MTIIAGQTVHSLKRVPGAEGVFGSDGGGRIAGSALAAGDAEGPATSQRTDSTPAPENAPRIALIMARVRICREV
jgi:hypothetical protein